MRKDLEKQKIGAAALNQTPLDWHGNKSRIISAINDAKQAGLSLLLLPELCISGYGCEDAFYAENTTDRSLKILLELLPETAGITLSVGLPLRFEGALFNVNALITNTKLLGFAAKRVLANDGVYYEARWFKAWPRGKLSQIEINSQFNSECFTIGDQIFQVDELKIGYEICEEAWVAERTGLWAQQQGADIILNPSASHFAFGKNERRKQIIREGSKNFEALYLYSNLLGNDAGRIIYEGGCYIANAGEIIAATPRFSFKDYQLTWVDLNASKAIPDDSLSKEEEFVRATTLGLFDYLLKSRSKGFVISLSGGVDSATVALLCAYTFHLVQQELGLVGLKERLKYISDIQALNSVEEIITALVSCIYQSTANSSERTRDAAAGLARALHATFYQFDVEGIVDDYKKLVVDNLGKKLDWQNDDLALQNIQARVRGPGVWLVANIKQALLLATSNRSEAAVGYTTMDGDTCGGLSPIAGVDKAYLRTWLKWAEKVGPVSLYPVSELGAVNSQEPTAELRPASFKQSDEDDLMPYEVLDIIERLAIRDRKSPREIFDHLVSLKSSPAPNKQEIYDWVYKFFTLWSRNQWKRERYAPSFHLDDENLDPKSWCRFPILSGGYEVELQELKSKLD
jgi:NAD+ synthase (glutamine-hydrolysing)